MQTCCAPSHACISYKLQYHSFYMTPGGFKTFYKIRGWWHLPTPGLWKTKQECLHVFGISWTNIAIYMYSTYMVKFGNPIRDCGPELHSNLFLFMCSFSVEKPSFSDMLPNVLCFHFCSYMTAWPWRYEHEQQKMWIWRSHPGQPQPHLLYLNDKFSAFV